MLPEVYPTLPCANAKGWPVREGIKLPYFIQRTGHRVYHTTGFGREEIVDLCIRVNVEEREHGAPNWPRILGLFKLAVIALVYMRTNLTQVQIGEFYGVSQPTISRAVMVITPLIAEATSDFVPTAEDLNPESQYIIGGTLLPCCSWKEYKEPSPAENLLGNDFGGNWTTVLQGGLNKLQAVHVHPSLFRPG